MSTIKVAVPTIPTPKIALEDKKIGGGTTQPAAAPAVPAATVGGSNNSGSGRTGSTSTTVTTTGPNEEYLAYLLSQAQAGERARAAALNAGIEGYEAQRAAIALAQEDSARGAYIRQQQSFKNLPVQLAQNGISGGLAESNHVRINTRYGQEMAGIERDYVDRNMAINNAIAALQAADAVAGAKAEEAYYAALAGASAKTGTTATIKTTSGGSSNGAASGGGTASTSGGTAVNTSHATNSAATSTRDGKTTVYNAAGLPPKSRSARIAELSALGCSTAEINAVLAMEGY